MDFLRTAYTTKFKPWQDDATEIEVRWFRCPDNAKSVPMPNIYSSGLWDDPKSSRVTVGDVYPQQRRWNGGENLAGYLGLAPCGPPQAFNTGGVHGRDPSIVTDASGVAPCCKTVRLLGVGGFALGGAALFNNQVVWSGGKGVGGTWRVATGPVFAWSGGKGIGGKFVTSTGPTFAWTGGKGIGGHFVEVPDVAFEWSGGKGLGGFFEVAAGPAERWSGGKGLGGAWTTVEGIGYRWSGGKGLGGSFQVAAGPAERWSGGKGLGGAFRSGQNAVLFAGGKGLGGSFLTVPSVGYRFAGGKGLGGSWQVAVGPYHRFHGGKGEGGSFPSAAGPGYPWTGGIGGGGSFPSAAGPGYPWTGGIGGGGSFPSGSGPAFQFTGGKGVGGTFTEDFDLLPGMMVAYGGSSAPSGYLICDGSSQLRSTYPGLFAAIGTNYGAADGSHFNLPDRRGRVSVGPDPAGIHMPSINPHLGSGGGEDTHTLIANEMPTHVHSCSPEGLFLTFKAGGPASGVQAGTTLTGNNLTQTSSAGLGAAHNNVQPYSCDNWIIKT